MRQVGGAAPAPLVLPSTPNPNDWPTTGNPCGPRTRPAIAVQLYEKITPIDRIRKSGIWAVKTGAPFNHEHPSQAFWTSPRPRRIKFCGSTRMTSMQILEVGFRAYGTVPWRVAQRAKLVPQLPAATRSVTRRSVGWRKATTTEQSVLWLKAGGGTDDGILCHERRSRRAGQRRRYL